MTELIRLEPFGEHESFKVYYYNGVECGEFLRGDDGYYDWWPEFPSNGGCLASHFLREIADKLDKLNEPWDKQIQADFKELNASIN